MSSIIAISWTVVIVLAAPIAGFVTRRPLAARERPRLLVYAGSAVNLILFSAITATIDHWHNGKALAAATLMLPLSHLVAWSLGVLFVSIMVSIGIFFIRGKLRRPPSAIVISLLPATPTERAVFVLLCLVVGIAEEFLFRGFAFLTIAGIVRSPLLAVGIVTISFALQHGIQDAIGIIRAFVLGAVLAVPVLVTRSLIPSIVAHAAIDVFSGLYGPQLMERLRSK